MVQKKMQVQLMFLWDRVQDDVECTECTAERAGMKEVEHRSEKD